MHGQTSLGIPVGLNNKDCTPSEVGEPSGSRGQLCQANGREARRNGAEASFSGSQGHPPKTLVIFPFCKCNQGCEQFVEVRSKPCHV